MKLSPLQIIKLPLRFAVAFSTDTVEISGEGSPINEIRKMLLNACIFGSRFGPC